MKLLKSYIQNFLSRAGSYVFAATVIARILSFLASWIALQLIPNKELGIVLFAYNIVAFIIPIGGFGLHQSLIRYGAILKTEDEKNSLFVYVLKKGVVASVLIILVVTIIGLLVPFQFPNTNFYVAFLSIVILPSFLLEIIKIQFRLQHNNKYFAYTEVVFNVVLVIAVWVLSYFYKEIGYAFALILAPTISILFFIKKININFSKSVKLSITNFAFWKYGFFASLSSVIGQLLFVIDVLLIGHLLEDPEMVTNYKYISLIPFSLLFLPRVFMSTDFVAFTEKIHDKNYIINYIKSYVLLFSSVSIALCVFLSIFSKQILNLFDSSFYQFHDSFLVLVFGICGILILRSLFGNLLASIGKVHVNFYITGVALLINFLSNYYLIPKYGILGAAITSSVLMWFTGIASFILFWYLYTKDFLVNK